MSICHKYHYLLYHITKLKKNSRVTLSTYYSIFHFQRKLLHNWSCYKTCLSIKPWALTGIVGVTSREALSSPQEKLIKVWLVRHKYIKVFTEDKPVLSQVSEWRHHEDHLATKRRLLQDCHNRHRAGRQIGTCARQLPQGQSRCLHVETSGYSRGAQEVDRAFPKSRPQSHPQEAASTTVLTKQVWSYQERASKTTRRWFYQRALPPRVVR